ncbi:pleckstrin homology domain-containing family G member 5-like isoform X2 [Saccostrea echinata]|uniref:pleckstrin homology domain-containing family G member 5-like isoform X2 n=1 Tax=Saccostrea echinata TaxID=191078 RepID=UPI002A81DCDC|nr:pleckstrin homology domain-containing family G member 5-like isoform X2 [Saccostrea echinata]
MPKKSKPKKIKVQAARQLSSPEKSASKKKIKLTRQSHSSSEIYQLQANSSVDDDNVDTPPLSNSRPTSPLNFFLPILEYGFSWPRRKSPLKLASEQKRVRSPLLPSSPDSGLPNSPVSAYDDLFSPSTENKKDKEILSVPEPDRNPSPLSMVLEHNSSSSCSDGETESQDLRSVLEALDYVIQREHDDKEHPYTTIKHDSSEDEDTSDALNNQDSPNNTSDSPNNESPSNTCDSPSKSPKSLEHMNGIIKDGKGSVSKRVRFNIDKSEVKKGRNCDIVKALSEPCLYGITVTVVNIQPKKGGGESCTVTESFQAMVCHHPDCSESNGGHPLLMCKPCDKRIHGNLQNSNHLVLDAPKKKLGLAQLGRGSSSPNLGTRRESHSELNRRHTEPEDGDDVDGIYIKKPEVHEFRPPPTPSAAELKLKRKKALKLKRRHTDSAISDECFTIRFVDVSENELEVVAAVRGISLRASIQPILERRGMDINRINAFVEASKTPLPLDCECFLLGGNTLNIKEKDFEGGTGKSRPNSGSKNSKKNSGMGRRESLFGRVPPVVEPPSVKQRRNSLSIPFFSHPTPKQGDGPRLLDDNQSVGSLRSRRGINLSIDDMTPIPQTLSSSVSPQGTISFNEGRRIKDRSKLTNLFSPAGSKDREKHEQLSEILNKYSSNGIPAMPDLLNIGRPCIQENLFEIEPHWSSVVDNASMLTKRQHDQQEAIWELLNTELLYIKALRVIVDLFMCCLINLQSESILNEIETELLFGNISDVLTVNCDFWESHLLKVLTVARENRTPLNPSDMKDGFKKFGELFGPYTKYCTEQKNCTEYMKARYADNDLFKTFVVWAETQKQCNRLKLTDLLVKPMQRLTKYSLLLQAILRKTEDDRQRRDLLEMIGGVDKFVSHVNVTLRHKHDQERLNAIVAKIESYDAVESPNDECLRYIQEYYDNFDLRAPMPGCGADHTRTLIMQSVLKLKDSATRMDVECLLFTDLLLICKPSKRMEKYKIIKPPMRVDRMMIQELKDKGSFLLIYLNEYHVPVSAFTFHADQASIRVWVDHIRKAQTLYREARRSSQGNSSFINPGNEEVVEEEVIRTTPLHPLNEDVLLSPSTTPYDVSELFRSSSSPMPSPIDKCSPHFFHKSHSEQAIQSHRLELAKERTRSEDIQSGHPPVQSSYSVPNFDDSLNPEEEEEKGQVHSSSNGSSATSNSSLPDILDDGLKQKLNQRRSSRTDTKRYLTADAIRELSKHEDKDTSIYKRLSWNCGTKDEEIRQNTLKNKVQSTDSIRSVHSSSGVSSTGSLHLSPEVDVIEDLYQNNNDISTIHESSCNEEENISEKDRHKSKSTTDIAKLFEDLHTSEVKDGISSVDIPANLEKRKFSHAQIMKIKKQLLLSSNVEASEV